MGTLRAGHGLDPNGFIVSDVSIDKIDGVYVPCIRESVESLKKLFPLQLHSVYIYGSVARGEAVAFKSDIDLIAMFEGNVQTAELTRLAEALSQKYCSLVREVGIAVADYDYTMDPFNYYENAFLKELCVCVYGEDVRDRFGPYKLTSEIAIRFNGDIGEAVTRTLERIKTASDEEVKRFSQSFARKLIRTYYSMVMVRSQIWTTRLGEQSEVFLHYFPEKESIIHILLNWIDEPPTEREAIYEIVKNEGEWARSNFTHEANSLV